MNYWENSYLCTLPYLIKIVMATAAEAEAFLETFKAKLGVWGAVFRDDRGKNAQALLSLEITPAQRQAVLQELQQTDYCQGPLEEKLYGGADMWVFGKMIKGQEVYIKITTGLLGAQVICISFHLAEHPLSYPLKT